MRKWQGLESSMTRFSLRGVYFMLFMERAVVYDATQKQYDVNDDADEAIYT